MAYCALNSAVVYVEEKELLTSPNWFNDSVLCFAFEYFTYYQFKAAVRNVKFVTPAQTFVMLHEDGSFLSFIYILIINS